MQVTSKVVERDHNGNLVSAIGASVFLVDRDSTTLQPLLLRNKAQGAVTDIQGRFFLNIDPDADFEKIAITYMGMKPIITDVDTIRKTLVFELEESVNELEEIVITGTPTKKKESFPAWILGLLIPIFFAMLYMISKILSKDSPVAKKR